MGILDHLTCLLRNLYASQEATVETTWNNRLVANWGRSTSRLLYCHLAYLTYMQSQFSSVQLLSRVWLFATPWTAACQASLSITNSCSPPKPMSIESVMPSNHLILCHPLLLLISIFPSIRVFSNESALRIRWPKYWSFSFNISPTNEHPGLIFRMDWLDVIFKKLFYIVASVSYWLPITQLVKNPPAMQETSVWFLCWKGLLEKGQANYSNILGFLAAQLVKYLPAVQKTWVRSLGWEDPLEKGKATHLSILVWKIPWTV